MSFDMNKALKRLAKQRACPGHVFGLPRTYQWHPRGPKHPAATTWYVMCRKCGARFSRDTLEQLRAEVPGT